MQILAMSVAVSLAIGGGLGWFVGKTYGATAVAATTTTTVLQCPTPDAITPAMKHFASPHVAQTPAKGW